MGMQALASYRDNCKVGQPLSAGKAAGAVSAAVAAEPTTSGAPVHARPIRTRLPKQRPSVTTSFRVAGADGYLTAGSYPDDGLGEIFLRLGSRARPWPV